MLSSVAWRTPPLDYGPWERVASLLTEGLVARGEDVTKISIVADKIPAAEHESRVAELQPKIAVMLANLGAETMSGR